MLPLNYNQERWHQSLNYKTPDDVYKTASGGDALIVDKFNGKGNKTAPMPQKGDSTILLQCEQSSILTH